MAERETLDGWHELILTAVIALAAVGTAWAGFQSAKWGGVQANSYAQASASRTESTRQSTTAGQFVTIDVITFTDWLAALQEERDAEGRESSLDGYEPDPDTLSGELFNRFRTEFKPAVRAWLDTRPLSDPDAPSTPFAMPEYRPATLDEAETLLKEAESLSAKARQANQRSDNYVLTAVLFALVLFFATLTQRASRGRSRVLLLSLTIVTLLSAVTLLVTFPIQI
ncbi:MULTISPECIES: hypothetical protein [unclassified Streptomyces]|uniref:hypothetical protein n=1 Tax=unclassified Streptomyces TaxID=2593676 RepID=UPI0022B5EF84|nr:MULTISPECIES: hypothetical protein [unclassified Streptomyces]MCZ7413934.1 hypothetical protein [Streptomyces sp. WMMC897]MCZ7430930.1 hypothetical protein [Streptomyces sp. WMMC1477]